MAGGVNRKISAASARAHTRRAKQNTSFQLPSGLFKKALVLFFVGFLAWAYQAIQPPPPKICGTPDGPPVTAPRIKLRDGRHLAYKEQGVSKDSAKHKIVHVHGFGSCRHDTIAKLLSPEVVEELGVYIVAFDRPGYGESDPDPKRTVKSLALDIEELADQLGLGPKFYVTGFSMGGQVVWSTLKYIPHRLAGAVLIAPVINYWWTGLPANLSNEVYKQQFQNDQWSLRVAHYAPWLTYWWNTQKWFPYSSVVARSRDILSRQDKEIVNLPVRKSRKEYEDQTTQQGEYESLFQDMNWDSGSGNSAPQNWKIHFQTTKVRYTCGKETKTFSFPFHCNATLPSNSHGFTITSYPVPGTCFQRQRGSVIQSSRSFWLGRSELHLHR